MPLSKKAAAMAAGLVAALTAATVAQQAPSAGQPETLSVSKCTIDWIEKSDVSALREGVIKKMELQVGDTVEEGGTIGLLHSEMAELTVVKAQVAADNVGPIRKGEAQRDLAQSVLARDYRLLARNSDQVAKEDLQKHEAELKVSLAMVLEAAENQKVARAELALAKRTLEEHTIKAPFAGVIIDRKKHPGESVRANEPVVRLANTDRLRAVIWVPLEHSFKVKVGDAVDVTPNIPEADLPIEKKRFRGKITLVDPEIQPVQNEVRVYAEIQNVDRELRPGLTESNVIIYLNTAGKDVPTAAAPAPTAPQPVATAVAGDGGRTRAKKGR